MDQMGQQKKKAEFVPFASKLVLFDAFFQQIK
jgi:peptidase E